MYDGTLDSFKSIKQSNSMTFMLFILFSKPTINLRTSFI